MPIPPFSPRKRGCFPVFRPHFIPQTLNELKKNENFFIFFGRSEIHFFVRKILRKGCAIRKNAV